ncbi:YIP1 family protein [Deinococcus sp. NW-56]|uniref:YIP1 family protein n=1 Tax=Deinococcus sp. NW-56 TaxID=2080419 RepID=UPI000CF3D033|nr:YIP1 family protein [Deinococcus sp. NW-56]
MARPRPTPAPPPTAPLAAELLSGPAAFFERLRQVPPLPWRYALPPVLAALLAGVVYALLLRPVVGATAQGAAAFASYAVNVFGTFFLTVVGAALMAGLGWLGAGREGRAPEVYGATFVLLPPLYLTLSVLVLLSGTDLGLIRVDGAALSQRELLEAVMQGGLARVTVLLLLLAPLAQFALAYRGFLTLTGDRRRALLGTLLPLLPVLAVTALGLAPLLAAW